VIAVCTLAAVLRFASLGVQSFDYDESFTEAIVGGSIGHALHQIPVTESTPPLYYVLAWGWTRVFGLGASGIRSLSALCGTAVVPVAFLIGRRLASVRAGLIAALLVAVNPLMVWYSQEARSYALLALLCALSFWAFEAALEDPRPRVVALWALASAAAVLTHYFAAFLVAPEAVWLLYARRSRATALGSAVLLAVAAALIPLILRQADHRADWIAHMSLVSRIKEVAKKWVTGEIAPTRNWVLVAVAVPVSAAAVTGATQLSDRERRGAIRALSVGGAAVLIPLALEVAGLHYLISKNVMPALTVLLIAAGVLLGARRARWLGLAGAAIGSGFFVGLSLAGPFSPTLQRPDYRDAARALGPPVPGQAVVAPRGGDAPLAYYRPGAVYLPAGGWAVNQVVVVQPVPRADVSSRRPPTPAPPPGFLLVGRRDAPRYTLICYAAPTPRAVGADPLLALAGGATASVQVWPRSHPRGRLSPCTGAG